MSQFSILVFVLLSSFSVFGQETNQSEQKFQSKIKEAEVFAAEQMYEQALISLEQALVIKPTDKQALQRLDELDRIIFTIKSKKFDSLVSVAETLKNEKKYQEAINAFEEAFVVKNESYVMDQIYLLNKTIAEERKAKEDKSNYENAMFSGDKMANEKKYILAKDFYMKALKIKPGDPSASASLKEIQQILEGQQKN